MGVLEEFGLDGRRAVVTGGGKGIGRGIARCLAEAGADVVVSARSTADIDAVADEINALGRRGVAVPADVTEDGALESLGAAAAEALGGIDIWINNAGGLPDATPRYLTRTPDDRWDAQLDLNLKAVWKGCVVAASHMVPRPPGEEHEAGHEDGASRPPGTIINISSSGSRGPQMKNGPYGAAKAAVNSLTETLSVELAPHVRVNAIAPGPIPTENFIESVQYKGERKAFIDKGMNIPLKRLGTDRDIGSAVVFLASPASSWITGQVLRVTGGR